MLSFLLLQFIRSTLSIDLCWTNGIYCSTIKESFLTQSKFFLNKRFKAEQTLTKNLRKGFDCLNSNEAYR